MSQRNSGYVRKQGDLYQTPEWVTEALLSHVPNDIERVWEPAAGMGQMVHVLRRRYDVIPTDAMTGTDFLSVGTLAHFDTQAIMTNPPYTLATEFCTHAIRLMVGVGGVIAMLLRTDFDHAKSRTHLFRDCPAFAKKVVLMQRIVWFTGDDGKPKASPSFNHAWYIWNWRHAGAPTIAYGP